MAKTPVDDLFETKIPKGLEKIAELLKDAGIEPDAVGKIEKIKHSSWEGFSKDANGDVTVTPLSGTSVVLSPKWAEGPKWPVIQQARLTNLPPVKKPRQRRTKYRKAVILPDTQIGFRQTTDGCLDPFHDEVALSIALRMVERVDPDDIILLGDLLDFASLSKYVQEPAFGMTTQETVDRGHLFLAQLRALAPDANMVLLEGNHDQRLPSAVMQNAAAAFGIKQANVPDAWPVMSVPHLLRLDDLKVTYVSGYPSNRYYINERLACAHTPAKMRSGGSSAVASLDDERVSVITGHVHRIETAYKTRNVLDGARTNFVATVGCLCRIDGAVPSVKSALDAAGCPITHYENWQQAVTVVTYQPGDGDFAMEIVPIFDGKAIFRGEPV